MATVTLTRIRTCELVSAAISFIFLIAALVLFTDTFNLNSDLQAADSSLVYWTAQTLWIDKSKYTPPNPNLLVDTPELIRLEFPSSTDSDDAQRNDLVGVVTETEPGKVRVVYLFVIIFGVSVAAQLYRSNVFHGLHDSTNVGDAWDPRQPDISRWLEYGLTAPLQILLLAGEVQLHDLTAWYGLVAAEFALMFIGYGIELVFWQMHCCAGVTHDNDSTKSVAAEGGKARRPEKLKNLNFSAAVLTFAGWLIHVAIFYTLVFSKYIPSISYFDTLNPDFEPALDWTPITVTLVLQFILFSSFGLVQLGLFDICPASFLMNWLEVDDSEFQEKNLAIRNAGERTFVKVSLLYTILSVLSKAILEIGFVAIYAAMPGVVAVADSK